MRAALVFAVLAPLALLGCSYPEQAPPWRTPSLRSGGPAYLETNAYRAGTVSAAASPVGPAVVACEAPAGSYLDDLDGDGVPEAVQAYAGGEPGIVVWVRPSNSCSWGEAYRGEGTSRVAPGETRGEVRLTIAVYDGGVGVGTVEAVGKFDPSRRLVVTGALSCTADRRTSDCFELVTKYGSR